MRPGSFRPKHLNWEPAAILPPIARETLRERCVELLRGAITSGQFAPGAHLSEIELATSLGVSRATVREALRHLEQDGLAVPSRRGMLHVRILTVNEIRELYAVRGALEALAGELVAVRADRNAAADVLDRAVGRLQAAEGDLPAQIEADLAFHATLCELAGNTMLSRHWRSLEGAIRITVLHAGPRRALHNMAAARHRPIVDAIRGGDPELTRRTVVRHMAEAADRLARAAQSRSADRPPG